MALIRTGAFVDAIAGKVRGTTFQRNRYGQIVKGSASITTRHTASQSARRSQWQIQSRRWAQLTQAQRDVWNAAAAALDYQNRFGDDVTLTGFNFFVKRNVLAQMMKFGDIDAPGSTEPVPEIEGLALDVNLGGSKFDISWTSGAVPTGVAWGIMASRPLSPGIDNPREQFRFIGQLAEGNTSSQNFYSQYAATWPTFATSTGKFWVKVMPFFEANALEGVEVTAWDIAS